MAATKLAEAYVALRVRQEALASQLSHAKTMVAGTLSRIDARSVRSSLMAAGLNADFVRLGVSAVGMADAVVGAYNIMAGGINMVLHKFYEQEEAEARLEAVLKATGHAAGFASDELNTYAKTLSGVTKFSDQMTTNAMAIGLSFREVQGPAFKEAITLAQDMATVFRHSSLDQTTMQLFKALNMPTHGLGALQRVGIQFNAQQREMIHNFMETGQVAKAQAIILEEVRNEVGGAALEFGKLSSGRFAIAMNQINDIVENIGKSFVPVLDIVLPKFIKSMQYVELIIANIEPEWLALGAALTGFATTVSMLAVGFPLFLTVVGALAGVVQTLISPFGVLLGLISLVGYTIAMAFQADEAGVMVGALYRVWAVVQDVAAAFQGLWASLLEIVQPVIDRMIGWWQTFFDKVATFVESNRDTFVRWGVLINRIIQVTVARLVDMLMGFFDWVSEMWNENKDDVAYAWDAIAGFITETLFWVLTILSDWKLSWKLAVTSIAYYFEMMFNDLHDSLLDAVSGVAGFYKSIVAGAGAMASNVVSFFSQMKNQMVAMWIAAKKLIMGGVGANPLEFLRETYRKTLADLDEESKNTYVNIGEEAGKAFDEGFAGIHAKMGGAADRRVEIELGKMADKAAADILAAREGIKKDIDRELKDVLGRMKGKPADEFEFIPIAPKDISKPEIPDRFRPKGHEPPEPKKEHPGPAFIGFTDLWKKMQEALVQGSMVEFAKLTAEHTARAAVAGEQANIQLEAIAKALQGLGPGGLL